MADKLSHRQREILYFIAGFMDDNSYSPTIREIGDGVGMASTSHVARNLSRLQEYGYITRTPGISRSIVPNWEHMADVIKLAEA